MKNIAFLIIFLVGFFHFSFSQSPTNKLLDTGRVGIGTTSPLARLHIGEINQEIRFDYNGNSHYGSLRWAGLQLGNNGVNRIVAGRSVPGGWMDFHVNNTNDAADYGNTPDGLLAMRINYDGNVGIGNNSPSHKLHLGNSNNQLRLDYNNTNNYFGELDWAALQFGNNGVNRIIAGRTQTGGLLDFYVNNTNDFNYTNNPDGILAMRINSNGNVLIGKTTQANTSYKFDVDGSVRANEIKVNTTGADFVFEEDYKLRSLAETEAFIKANKHLPEIAPAETMKKEGIELGEMNIKLLQKIEELTLYLIEQDKELKSLRRSNNDLTSRLLILENK